MLFPVHLVVFLSFTGAIISVPILNVVENKQSTLENTATMLQILTALNNIGLAFQNFGNTISAPFQGISNIFFPTKSPIENLVGSLTTTKNPLVVGVENIGSNIQQVLIPSTTTQNPLGIFGGLLQSSTTRKPLGGIGNLFTTTTKNPLAVIGENIGNVVKPPGVIG